jgi:hypothetical protein
MLDGYEVIAGRREHLDGLDLRRQVFDVHSKVRGRTILELAQPAGRLRLGEYPRLGSSARKTMMPVLRKDFKSPSILQRSDACERKAESEDEPRRTPHNTRGLRSG